jgi:uncharacterized membrane protein
MTNRLPTAAVAPSTKPQPRSHASWPWIVVALVIGVGKTEGVRLLGHHVWGWAILLGVASAWSLLRARPVLTALFAAPAISLLLKPRPVGIGVAVGFATFAVLVAVFVAIGTVLRNIDNRRERPVVASAPGA